MYKLFSKTKRFQLTAARRRLEMSSFAPISLAPFQLTAARRRLGGSGPDKPNDEKISTHSRAKAAGCTPIFYTYYNYNFNSQPREGGWQNGYCFCDYLRNFNSQPREGGWIASYK